MEKLPLCEEDLNANIVLGVFFKRKINYLKQQKQSF